MPLGHAALVVGLGLTVCRAEGALAAPCRAEPAMQAVDPSRVAAAVRALEHSGVTVREVCRDGRGLRFYAAFEADPQSGPNTHLYNRLFIRLTTLLAARHVTLVDKADALAIMVDRASERDLSVSYEPWPARP